MSLNSISEEQKAAQTTNLSTSFSYVLIYCSVVKTKSPYKPLLLLVSKRECRFSKSE